MPYSIVHLCLLSLGAFSFPTVVYPRTTQMEEFASSSELEPNHRLSFISVSSFYMVAETLPHSTSLLCFYTAIRINSTLTESHAVEVTLATYCRPLY